MDSPTPPWAPYSDLFHPPRRKGARLGTLLGSDPPPAQIHRPENAGMARDWYSSHTQAAMYTLGQLMPVRLWQRVSAPRARAHCPMLETLARACDPVRSAERDTLFTIAENGFADLGRTPEHGIVRALARARQNQVANLALSRGLEPAAPGPPLRDLALCLRLLGVQACLAQNRIEWCPCLRALLSTGPLPGAHRILELSTRFSPRYGLSSTA